MKVAFVSYEYPPETGYGGIATYVYQISRVFSSRGERVHVICASPVEDKTIQENNCLTIHRLYSPSHHDFNLRAAQTVQRLHQEEGLDLIEAPEYGGDGAYIKEYLPDVPLIVKLHTPNYFVKKLNDFYFDKQWHRKIKYFFKPYHPEKDNEYQAASKADYIISPSRSLKSIVAKDWKLDESTMIHAPYIYQPSQKLLEIPEGSSTKTVLYFGRLETRKGVFNLSKAVPMVLKEVPDAHFIFVGGDCKGTMREKSMKMKLQQMMNGCSSNVTFINTVPLEAVPDYLAKAAVCVFPSLWENFPNVCLEAMSAGRAIVASKNGGMRDMLEDIKGGILIDPHNVNELASSIVKLLKDASLAREMGARCRQKIKTVYSEQTTEELLRLYNRLAGVHVGI